MSQTLHKLYIEPYIEAFQTLHSERTRNYTRGVQKPTQNPARNLMLKFEKPFPLGRGWGRLPPKKIQQFWAIFQQFDINIFNLSEHFPPRNFAYSAHNFSLPSPNLN